ncbi:SH3 domain-containing protein [candidate division KSB1 bacterium]
MNIFGIHCKRSIFKNFIVPVIVIVFSISDLPAFQQAETWNSVTLSRVNLREGPSQQTQIITTLENLTIITVIGETPGWFQVSLEDGSEGWISSDFAVPRAAIDVIGPSLIEQETAERPPSAVAGRQEFTTEREPASGAGWTDQMEDQSFLAARFDSWHLNLILPLIIGLSVLANIFLFHWVKTAAARNEVPGDQESLVKNLNLLKKETEDLKNQLSFSKGKIVQSEKTIKKYEKDLILQKELHSKELTEQRNKFNRLEETHKSSARTIKEKDDQITRLTQASNNRMKDLEAAHQKISKIEDMLQQQAIKLTLAEQKHNEALLQKQNSYKELENKLTQFETQKEEMEKEHNNLVSSLKENTARLKKHNESLEQSLADHEKSTKEKIAQAVKNAEQSFEEKIKESVAAEQDRLQRAHEEELEKAVKVANEEKESLKSAYDEKESEISELKEEITEKAKAQKELETQFAELKDTVRKSHEEAAESAEFEALQRDFEKLKTEYETSKKVSSERQDKWLVEKQSLLDTINELKLAEEAPVLVTEKIEAGLQLQIAEKEEGVPDIKTDIEVKPVPPEIPAMETVTDEKQYEDFAKSFFRQFKSI